MTACSIGICTISPRITSSPEIVRKFRGSDSSCRNSRSIVKSVPKDVREGKVDAKNMHELFVPANRNNDMGYKRGLFKLTVLG